MNQKIVWCALFGASLLNQLWGTHARGFYGFQKSEVIQTIVRTPIFDRSEAQAALKMLGCNPNSKNVQDVLRISNNLALCVDYDIASSMSAIPSSDAGFKAKLSEEITDRLLGISFYALMPFTVKESKILSVNALENVLIESYQFGLHLRSEVGDVFVDIVPLEKMLPGFCVLLNKQIAILCRDKDMRDAQMIGSILGDIIASTISRALYSNPYALLDPEHIGRAKRYNLTTIQVLRAIRVIESGVPLRYDGADPLVEPYIKQIEQLILENETCCHERRVCCRICSEWIYLMRKLYIKGIDPDQCNPSKLVQEIISQYHINAAEELFDSLSPVQEIAKQLLEIDKLKEEI